VNCSYRPTRAELVIGSVLVLGVCIFAWLLRRPDLGPLAAISGWSPLDWVTHREHPTWFASDFPNGIQAYSKSLAMFVYPLANHVGIAPDTLVPWFILIEYLFLSGSVIWLSRTLAPGAAWMTAPLTAVIVVSSFAREMDLSFFASTFFLGLFYNIADGLRLLAIAQYLRGRVISASLLLAAGFTVHPLMTAFGGIFILGYWLVERNIPIRRIVAGITAFLVIAVLWWSVAYRGAEIAGGAIDPKIWIELAQTFSFHFYGIDNGLLGRYYDERVPPLLSLAVLAVFYLPRASSTPRRCNAILCGFLLLAITAVAGLLISSQHVISPLLVKLQLPRASAVFITICLIIAVAGLYQDLLKGSIATRALAATLLLAPFFARPGFAMLLVALLVLPRLHQSAPGQSRAWQAAMLLLCIGAAIAAYHYQSFALPYAAQQMPMAGTQSMWQIAAAGAILATASWLLRRTLPMDHIEPALIGVIVACAAGYGAVHWQLAQRPDRAYVEQGREFMAAQRWAQAHTATDSLFMVDPTIYYGWRDYSERSSFGNLREWLHTGWLYDSSKKVYDEGMRRFAEFGEPLAPYLGHTPPMDGFYQLNTAIEKRFYEAPPSWFVDLGKRYGIDYVVLMRKKLKQDYPFEKVFENTGFVIYRVPR